MKTMRSCLFLLVIISSFHAFSQHLQWARYMENQTNYAYLIAEHFCMDPSGSSLFVTGQFRGDLDTDPSMANATLQETHISNYIARFSEDGTPLWGRHFPTTDKSYFPSFVTADSSGNSYLLGSFRGEVDADPGPGTQPFTAMATQDIFIVKLDPDGNFVWAKHGSGYPGITGDIELYGDDLYITGYFGDTLYYDGDTLAFGENKGCIIKMDTSGNILWTMPMNGEPSDLQAGPNGTLFVTGSFTGQNIDLDPGPGVQAFSSQSLSDNFTARFTDTVLVWVNTYGDPDRSYGAHLDVAQDGSVYVSGTVEHPYYPIGANIDFFVTRFSDQGDLLWGHRFGTNADLFDIAHGTTVDEQGNVYIGGTYRSPNLDVDPGPGQALLGNDNSSGSAFLLKLDATGAFKWVAPFVSQAPEEVANVHYANGSLYLHGMYVSPYLDVDPSAGVYALPYNGQSYSDFILKLDTNQIAAVGIEEFSGTGFRFYPNPALASVSLEFDQPAERTVVILTLAGQLISERTIVGTSATIDLDNVASGTYLVEVLENGRRSVMPFVKR